MDSLAHPGKGTYVLVLYLGQPEQLRVGKLGTFALPAGYYAYAGSAMGSGGLAARLGHHLKTNQRPHWHVDYLRQVTSVQQIWYLESPERREHDWADMLLHMPGSTVIIPRFGASDCRCASHLFYFGPPPDFDAFQNQNARRFPADEHLHCVNPFVRTM